MALADYRDPILRPGLMATTAVALLASFACNSNSAANSRTSSETASNATHIDVLCMGDRINSPTEPFHYSYKYEGPSGPVVKEADITPQTMELTIKNNSGSHSYHGVRSDEASWASAVIDLSSLNITAMSARLGSLNGTSAIVQSGTEVMNGYNTTKYVIDTTNANAADKRQFETLFGRGSFEKGTVWIPTDGCAVKLLLDEGISQGNGSVNKAHYEVAMIKK